MTNTCGSTACAESPVDDDAFAVLASERRRILLRRLRAVDGHASVRDLARAVTASERDADPETVSEEAIERVSVTLHHVHLPKLADAGYLRYDEAAKSVVPTGDVGSLGPLLDWAAHGVE